LEYWNIGIMAKQEGSSQHTEDGKQNDQKRLSLAETPRIAESRSRRQHAKNRGQSHKAAEIGASKIRAAEISGQILKLPNSAYSEILADLPGKEVSYLSVSWHRGSLVQFRIPPP